MPKTEARKPFHCLLSVEEYDMLNRLAAAEGVSAGQIMRAALRGKYAMQIARVPTCANGTRCFVPHMHQMAPAAQSPLPDREFLHG